MGCTNHPETATGIQQCWLCAKDFCGDCVVEFQGHVMCAPCKASAVARLEAGGVAGETETELPPWEKRAELGTVAAYTATVKRVMTGAAALFARMDSRSQAWDCLWFAVITQVLVAISSAVVQLVLGAGIGMAQQDGDFNPATMLSGGMGFIGVVLAPILALMGVFVSGGLIHLMLVLMKKAKLPYQQTVRGLCYANGPAVLGVIPFIGGIVGGIWALVSTILMIRERHRTTTGVALAAYFVPLLVIGCCIGGALFALGGMAALASR